MRYLLAACLMVLAFASASFAKLMPVSLEEVVKNSDFAVVGTLREISERTENGAAHGAGVIRVEKFIAGNVKTVGGFELQSGDKLRLNYVEGFSCIMGSHRRIENEKGVFLLGLGTTGEIEWQSFHSLETLAEVRALWKKRAKSKNVFKSVKTLNEIENIAAQKTVENSDYREPAVSFGVYSLERKNDYRPVVTLLVVLGSLALYYLLYRSRFRIR